MNDIDVFYGYCKNRNCRKPLFVNVDYCSKKCFDLKVVIK